VRYLLLICADERSYDNMTPEEATARTAAWDQYAGDLSATGKLRAGERLRPVASATTVRVKNGERLLSDGPFAETKEQLGGYFVIEAENLDEAIEWASRMPNVAHGGSTEVRPIWDM
jgi:hypothetical protein